MIETVYKNLVGDLERIREILEVHKTMASVAAAREKFQEAEALIDPLIKTIGDACDLEGASE
jgi:hypothetical protein